MPISLSHFLRQQLAAQQLSEKEFALRSGVGLSHIYQMLRGERKYVRGETLDRIAAGLGLTPSAMAVLMGKGAPDEDPDEAETLALYRMLPAEQKPMVKTIIRSLTTRADEPVPTAKSPSLRIAKKQEALAHELTNGEVVEGPAQRSRRANGKLHPVHAARWFSPKGMYRGLADAVLAMFLPNRDSGPLTAGA